MKNPHQTLLLFLLTFFQLGLTEAISQDNKEPFRTERFASSDAAMLEGELAGSSVSIYQGNVSEVIVHAFLKKNGRYLEDGDEEVGEFLSEFEVSIAQSGNTISISTKPKSSRNFNWKNRPSLSFEVITPGELDTHIRTSGGSVSIEGVHGAFDLASSGGSIRVADSSGEVLSQSAGGSFSLSDFQGNVEAKTSGGSIKVENLEGDIIAHTSGGGMSLADISGTIDAASSGGSIKASIGAVSGDMSFKSSGGSIQLAVSQSSSFDLDIRGGSIQSNLDHFSGSIEKNRVSGSVNGGGPALSLQSSGGSIRISN